MKQLKAITLSFVLFMISALLISCSTPPEPPTPASVPASSPEPAASNEISSEGKVPTELSEVPRIAVEELKERLDRGEEIVIIDTRSKTAFEGGHIAGAISMPRDEIELHLDELPMDVEIVLYCT